MVHRYPRSPALLGQHLVPVTRLGLLTLLGLGACTEALGPPPSTFVSPPSTGAFTDVTEAWGLLEPQATAQAGLQDDCETARFMTGAVAVGDVTQDGWPDLYLPRLGLPDRLMINQRGAGFEDRAPEAGLDLAQDSGGSLMFDRDGDGDLDLLVTSPTVLPRLFDNDGRGHFSEVAGAAGIQVPSLEPGACARMFGASLGDPDGDGDLDLVTAAWLDSDRSRLFENDGQGHFQDMSAAWGLDLSSTALLTPIFLDLDLDGDEDLLAVSDFDHTRIYSNDGAGRFNDSTATSTLARIHDGMGADVGDVDGDGDLDLFVGGICFARPSGCLDTSGWTGNHLFMNRGGGDYASRAAQAGVQSSGWAWGSTFFDPDLDGDLDLAVSHGYEVFLEFQGQPTALFENTGAAVFGEAWGLSGDGQGRAVLAFDVDQDGDQDLLVVHHYDPPRLFRNDLDKGHAHLTVTVDLGPMNRQGLGAQVVLRAPDRPAVRRLIGGHSHFGAHGPAEAWFGGLNGTGPFTVEVWVGGQRVHQVQLAQLPESGRLALP